MSAFAHQKRPLSVRHETQPHQITPVPPEVVRARSVRRQGMLRANNPPPSAPPGPHVLTVRISSVHVKLALEGLPRVIQRIRIGEYDVHVEFEAPQWRMRGGRMQGDAEGRRVEGDQHVRPSGDDSRQPVAAAVLGQHRVVGRTAVVEDEVVPLPGAVPPGPQGPGGLVQAGDADRTLHVHLVGGLLPHGDHRVLAFRHHLEIQRFEMVDLNSSCDPR